MSVVGKLRERIDRYEADVKSQIKDAGANPIVFKSDDTLSYSDLVKLIEDKFGYSDHRYDQALEHLLFDLRGDKIKFEMLGSKDI